MNYPQNTRVVVVNGPHKGKRGRVNQQPIPNGNDTLHGVLQDNDRMCMVEREDLALDPDYQGVGE